MISPTWLATFSFQHFCRLYQFKGITFLEELCSVLIYTPYLLLFRLPHYSHDIVTFFHRYTYQHPALGDFCKLAFFHDQDNHDSGMVEMSDVFGADGELGRESSGSSYAGAGGGGDSEMERLPHSSASLIWSGSPSMQGRWDVCVIVVYMRYMGNFIWLSYPRLVVSQFAINICTFGKVSHPYERQP